MINKTKQKEQKVLIWLEDKPDLNEPFRDIFEKSQFELVVCGTLAGFRKELSGFERNPTNVAGFVIDILIKSPDLADLDMEVILTEGGIECGLMVLKYYLRNKDGDSPVENTWKKHKVLMLTTLGSLETRYHGEMVNEEKQQHPTVWQSKADLKGDRDEAIKAVKTWVHSL